MKKSLAVLLALMMLFSCASVAAFADDAEAHQFPAMTFHDNVTVDVEKAMSLGSLFGFDENAAAIAKPLWTLLSKMGLSLAVADNGLQLDVAFNGEKAVTVAGEMDENGVAIASDLFPSYVLTVPAETVQAMSEAMVQANQSMAGVSGEEAQANFTNLNADLMAALAGSVTQGEIEKGEFNEAGYTFNTCIPYTVNMEALRAALVELNDKVMQDEQLAKIFAGLKLELPEANDDGSYNMPEVTALRYLNTDENGEPVDGILYMVMDIKFAEQNLATTASLLLDENGAKVVAHDANLDTDLELDIAPAEHGSLITFKTSNAGVYFAVVAQVGFASEQAGINIDVYVQDPDAPVFSNAFYVTEGGERTFTVRDDSKTEMNLLELVQDKDGELNSALVADAMNSGVNEKIANIYGLSADDVGVIFSMLAGAPAA